MEVIISTGYRFGYGSRIINDRTQYYAFYGVPNGNDDYYTTTEISHSEFNVIRCSYPEGANLSREEASAFQDMYISGHPVIYEGCGYWLPQKP